MSDRRGAPPLAVPGDLPQRLLMLLCGVVAFSTLSVTAFAGLAVAVSVAERGPSGLAELLEALPFAVVGGGAVFFYRRIGRERKRERSRAQQDALRAEARARSLGTLASHALDFAGPALAPPPASDSRETAGAGRRIVVRGTTAPPPGAVPGVSAPPPGSAFPQQPEQIESVRCTWCGGRVTVALGDPGTGDVTCPSCTTTFSMRGEMQKAMGMRPKPLGLDVTSRGTQTTIVHATADSAAGCGPVLLAGIFLLTTVADGLNTRDWTAAASAAAVVVVGAVFAGLWATRRTEYAITSGGVTVRTRGFLGRQRGAWRADEVDQVFVRERIRTETKRDGFSKRKRRVQVKSWDVILRDQDQRETRLAKGLEPLEWALYIEQEIENRLGVVNRRVQGSPQR